MYGQSKKSLGCWILGCSFLIYAASYGQTPTPPVTTDKPKQQNSKPQKNPASNQRGTEQAPLVIKILPSAQSEEPTAKENEKHENDSAHWLWKQWLNHWPEILLAFFTLGLWIATWQLVRGAKDTARRQLRAYVSIQITARPYPPSDPNRYAISLIVTNRGKTWARNLTIRKAIIRQELNDERDPFDLMVQPAIAPMVLGPGQTLDLQFGDIAYSDVPEIAKRKLRHSYVAVARYEDTVSPSVVIHQTQLSQSLNGDAEGGISFSYLPTHNCADEDCPS